MKTTFIKAMAMTAAAVLSVSAFAKLPPPSDEAKAKAAETKNKNAWSDKVAAYKLCEVQDRIAAQYLKEQHKPKPAVTLPPCQNPGPYVPLQANTAAVGVADAKPVPEVGAKK
jgi:hypothetical protein